MLLHLLIDGQFVDGIINLFETINPLENKYVLIKNGSYHQQEFSYTNSELISILRPGGREYKTLLNDSGLYDAILLHYLDAHKVSFVNSASERSRFVWMIWGGDAYGLIDGYRLYDDATIRLLENKGTKTGRISLCGIKKQLSELKRKFFKNATLRAIRKMQYCTTVIPDEYRIFSEKLPLKAEHLDFNYGIKDYFKGRKISQSDPSNIMIGNSGYPSCNHLSVIEKLGKMDIGDRKIIVPLSYGPKKYIRGVINAGKHKFDKAFIPVTDYLPYDEYSILLSGCSICIMNHYRQQGMGNIILLLWLGVRVYLRRENPVFNYLKGHGVLVFPIDSENYLLNSLTSGQKAHNKIIIENLYSKERILRKGGILIDTLITH